MLKIKRILLILGIIAIFTFGLVACGQTSPTGTGENTGGSGSNKWPTQEIKEYIGDGVPVYTGNYDTISLYIGDQKKDDEIIQLVVNMSGISQNDYDKYIQTLKDNGYEPVDNGYNTIIGYTKNNNKGKVSIVASFSDGFPLINIYLNKTSSSSSEGNESGNETSANDASWPTDIIKQKFPNANIPKLEGADSCTHEDYNNSFYLNITALGITEEEIKTYRSALDSANFTYDGLHNESESSSKYKKTVGGKTVNIILSWSLSDQRMSVEISCQ